MSSTQVHLPPAWQTEELQDEWPEFDSDDDSNDLSCGTQSVSLTIPLNTQIQTTADIEFNAGASSSAHPVTGTFLVRKDAPNISLLPKTPGRNNKDLMKSFFTPLPLERMFDPPTPPSHDEPEATSSRRSSRSESPLGQSVDAAEEDEIMETDLPDINSFHGRKASLACQFTFAMPRDARHRPNDLSSSRSPQAQSTPNQSSVLKNVAPLTDPRLRLFQFQYDTYTREHLSALVDSIAMNTPSGTATTATPTSLQTGVSEGGTNYSHLRSAKRIKLSPPGDIYRENAGMRATVARPKIYVKDYVGESRSLMEQIKKARDYSTISTVASSPSTKSNVLNDHETKDDNTNEQPSNSKSVSAQEIPHQPSFLALPKQTVNELSPSLGSSTSKGQSYSSSSYRLKAEALMDQIKNDVKRQKRVFSGESEISHVTTHVEGHNPSLSGSVKSTATGKENRRILSSSTSTHKRTSSSTSNTSRSRASPRKARKRAIDGITDISNKLSRLSIPQQNPIVNITLMPTSNSQLPVVSNNSLPNVPPSTLAPSYPSTSLRPAANEDMNRFVSSSTASGTTLTAGSAPSFVKHPGPAHIRTIAPGDLPSLPEQLGNMMFDKVMMRWVKNTAKAILENEKMGGQLSETSDDPFNDIESLRDDSKSREDLEQRSLANPHVLTDVGPLGPIVMSRIEERSEVDDEDIELSNFSTDASAHIVNVMTGIETDEYDDETTDSGDDDDDLNTGAPPPIINLQMEYDSFDDSNFPGEAGLPDFLTVEDKEISTPVRGNTSHIASPVIKSALKSNSATPNSALKDSRRQKCQTPIHRKAHRRSVSFSDGKRDGPIQGITASGGTVQSVRTKRITDMMNALEDSDEDESPSKVSNNERPEELKPLASRNSVISAGEKSVSPRRVFSRTYSVSPGRRSFLKVNGTFLTECSFGVAHDRLVQVITDVQPFEPHWEGLSSIDLSNAKLESVARLKEFLPHLDSLHLNLNSLAWLSGIPGSVRTLSVAHNRLTGLTSYSHLLNLESLDISQNEVESLRQLECLRHLRELRADRNKILNIEGLEGLGGLVKLSLEGNLIQRIDFGKCRWSQLEMLNISHNRIEKVVKFSSLGSLMSMNADMNHLCELEVGANMPRLRILRVSGNRLENLDVGRMANLRTLYADTNGLASFVRMDRLTKLENLSLRNQSGQGILLTRDVRDVKRLYLSGNPLRCDEILREPCYNLVYLELAACRLTTLPGGLAGIAPNLRVLNLNYNFLEDVTGLEGLRRLEKLSIIGSRLDSTKRLIRLVERIPDVVMLDFRMNPCTLGWYVPVLGREEEELDAKFRRDLPERTYVARLAYRGLVMSRCRGLRMLDGVRVSGKERVKAQRLVEGILGVDQRDLRNEPVRGQ